MFDRIAYNKFKNNMLATRAQALAYLHSLAYEKLQVLYLNAKTLKKDIAYGVEIDVYFRLRNIPELYFPFWCYLSNEAFIPIISSPDLEDSDNSLVLKSFVDRKDFFKILKMQNAHLECMTDTYETYLKLLKDELDAS